LAASYAPPGMWQDERTVGKTSRALLAANCGVRSTCGQTAVALEVRFNSAGRSRLWCRLDQSSEPICFSSYLCRARKLVERFFNKISTVAGSQRATTSWWPTISPSFRWRRSGYGCAL